MLIDNHPEKLMNLLTEFIKHTVQLKIILITNKPKINEMKESFDDEDIIEELSL